MFSGDTAGPAMPAWRTALGGAVTGIPSVQAGSVAVVLDGGHIKTFTLAGKPLWSYYAGGKLAPFVTRSREGTCYVYGVDGSLIAVNRAGRELWRVRPGADGKGSAEGPAASPVEPLSAPVLSGWDGRVFIPAGRTIFCYTASGTRLWSVELARKPAAGPALDKTGGLVMALDNGDLAEISPFGGMWTIALGEVPASIIPMEGGTLALFKNGRPRFFRNIQSSRDAQRASRVPVLESLPGLGGTPAGGTARGSNAAVLLSSGKLVLFSVSDGSIAWSTETHVKSGELASGGSGSLNMAWDEEGIYVFTVGGASGFTSAGKRMWLFRIKGAASLPVLSGDGVLYSGGSDWILYAYRLEERVLKRRHMIYGPLPEGNYGLADPRPSPWSALTGDALFETLSAEIAGRIAAGTVAEQEAAYTAFLMEAAGCLMGQAVSQTHPAVQARGRAEAARLLGYIGSRETIGFLAALFARDPDPLVKSAAAQAIGRIGVDPGGTALGVFQAAAASSVKDEQVLTAVAMATGSLCRFSGPPLTDTGARLLSALGHDSMPPKTKTAARKELSALR
jgi:outer membrane protein assembly factor BamB